MNLRAKIVDLLIDHVQPDGYVGNYAELSCAISALPEAAGWMALEEVSEALVNADERIEELEAKLVKAVRLMELSVELATWNTTLLDDVICFIEEIKGQNDE